MTSATLEGVEVGYFLVVLFAVILFPELICGAIEQWGRSGRRPGCKREAGYLRGAWLVRTGHGGALKIGRPGGLVAIRAVLPVALLVGVACKGDARL